MSSRGVTVVLTVAFYKLTVKNLLRVSPRLPVHCLMRCKARCGNVEWNRVWRLRKNVQQDHGVGFTVMLYKLTVSNCTESKTDVPGHCLMHNRTLSRVGTGVRRDYAAK